VDKNYYADGYEAGYQAGMAEKKPWVGLTDKELGAIYARNEVTRTRRQIHQAVEAKLREKNGG
jgi:hypothetical protein